jgi:hypothetical protein
MPRRGLANRRAKAPGGIRRGRRGCLGGLLALALLAPSPTHADGAFSSPLDYSELRGLPPRPASSIVTSADLIQMLLKTDGGLAFTLAVRYGSNKRIRLLESYSRRHPVYLKGTLAYLPNPDGVIDATPPVGAQLLTPAICADVTSTYTCAALHKPELEQEPYDATLIVGWDVELAGPVQTDGQGLLIVANRFNAREYEIDTRPSGYQGPEPAESSPGAKAADGRNGRSAGDVIVYAADWSGLRVLAEGQAGEAGQAGSDAIGYVKGTKVIDDYTEHPKFSCTGEVQKEAQSGGDGGSGGSGGMVWTRYTVLRGTSLPGPQRGQPLTERSCVGKCEGSLACAQHPALAICDFRRETDNGSCRDKKDNDGDGSLDCADSSCSKNPFVTVCPDGKNLKESSPEACSDGMDNDGDGKTDCAGPPCQLRQICGAEPGEPFAVTTGIEESTTAACSNGVDDDLDGKTDCKDPECRYNPLVSVCGGSERTLELCSNGLDDDHDGKTDCADSGCAFNPYVLICNSKPPAFMKESTISSCQDGLDNDGDGFIDCKDYECQNNPLASAGCGVFENTFDQCRDGVDNDGNNAVDCKDNHCRFNPFFGELLCQGKVKTKHVQLASAEASFAGVYRESDFRASTRRAAGAPGGKAGKRVSATVTVTYKNEWCDNCLDEECSYCVIEPENETCVIPMPGAPPVLNGANGNDGSEGFVNVKWTGRRRIDALRALLSPRQWVVGTAEANALFKRGGKADLEEAGFSYLHDIVRMKGVLAEMHVNCKAATPAGSPALALLHTTLCPAVRGDMVRLGYLLAGRNFYGVAKTVPLDPHERFEDQRDAFESLFGVLSQAVTHWIDLANGLDTSFQVGESKKNYDDLVAQLSGEIAIATARENALQAQLAAVETRLAYRKQALSKIHDAVSTNNAAIQEKYNTEDKGLGEFLLDLGLAFAKAYGGEILKDIGKETWAGIEEKLGGSFDTPDAPGSPGTPGQPASQKDAAKAFDEVWSYVKDTAEQGIKADAVEKAASSLGTPLEKFVLATPAKVPKRSVIVDEVANEILSASQQQIALDYLDLVLEDAKLRADFEIAGMERELFELRQLMAASASTRIEYYQTQVAELRAYDKILLGQQMYANATELVEDLTQRYWKMLRQADYQALAYGPAGLSDLYQLTKGGYDYNLKNYLDLGVNAAKLVQAFALWPRGGASRYFRRLPAADLKPATESDMAALEATGLTSVPPFDAGAKPFVAHLRVGYTDVQDDMLLRWRRNIRIDDVRVEFQAGGTVAPPVFLVRKALDGFRVQRQQQTDYFADFEIAARSLTPTATPAAPLHYQSLTACVHTPPGCDLQDATCESHLQGLPLSDFSCGLFGKPPGPAPWKESTFYDRSLVGDWMIVVPPDVMTTLGSLSAIDVSFLVASLDL